MSKIGELTAKQDAAYDGWAQHDKRMTDLWTNILVALGSYLGLPPPKEYESPRTHSLKAHRESVNGRRHGLQGIVYENEWAHFGFELEVAATRSEARFVRGLRAKPFGARIVVEYEKQEFWIEDASPGSGLSNLCDAVFRDVTNAIGTQYGPPLGTPENPIEWHSGEPLDRSKAYTNSGLRGLMPHDQGRKPNE